MSTYVPTDWVDGTTPVNAANLDKMEQGIADAHAAVAALDTRLDAEEVQPDIPPVQNGKWLSGQGGALVWADPPAGGSSIEYENVWAAGVPYTPGDVVKHNGIDYLAVNPSTGQTPPPYQAPSNVLPIPLVTSLPASPFDGQEVILTDSLTAGTYFHRMRYVAAKTTGSKWVFIGGDPQLAYGERTSDLSLPTGGADIITLAPITFDGATVIVVEFSANLARASNAGYGVNVWDGAVDLGKIVGSFGSSDEYGPAFGRLRLTPSAGAHTYKVRGYGITSAGTVYVTTGAFVPALLTVKRAA